VKRHDLRRKTVLTNGQKRYLDDIREQLSTFARERESRDPDDYRQVRATCMDGLRPRSRTRTISVVISVLAVILGLSGTAVVLTTTAPKLTNPALLGAAGCALLFGAMAIASVKTFLTNRGIPSPERKQFVGGLVAEGLLTEEEAEGIVGGAATSRENS
jgi:hypothetical protein